MSASDPTASIAANEIMHRLEIDMMFFPSCRNGFRPTRLSSNGSEVQRSRCGHLRGGTTCPQGVEAPISAHRPSCDADGGSHFGGIEHTDPRAVWGLLRVARV